MTSTECIAECPRDTHALRLSMAALVVAWLLPFSTALLGAGAFIAGVLMRALSILLRHYEGCAVGALLFVAVWRTALTAREELREAKLMCRQRRDMSMVR